MANFDGTTTAIQSQTEANDLQNEVRSLYLKAKSMQTRMQKYQVGTDPKFKSAIENLYTLAERAVINTMLSNANSLVTTWEANADMRRFLGIDPPTS